MDIILVILGIIFLLIGIIGSVLPVIPGPPLAFISLIFLRFTHFVETNDLSEYSRLLWILGAVTIIITILDFIVPVWGTKKFGGSKAGTLGAGIGVLIGLFFGPPGLILGPFLGAFIGELLAGKDQKTSLRAGFGSFLGFIFGVAMKISLTFIIGFYFFTELFK